MESVIADEKKNSTDFFNELQGFMDPAYQFRISRNYLHQTNISWLQKYSQMADEHHQKVRRVSNSPAWTGTKNGIFVHFIFFTLKFYSSPQLFAFNSSIKDHFHGFKWKFDEKRFYGLFKWSEVIPYEIILFLASINILISIKAIFE